MSQGRWIFKLPTRLGLASNCYFAAGQPLTLSERSGTQVASVGQPVHVPGGVALSGTTTLLAACRLEEYGSLGR